MPDLLDYLMQRIERKAFKMEAYILIQSECEHSAQLTLDLYIFSPKEMMSTHSLEASVSVMLLK